MPAAFAIRGNVIHFGLALRVDFRPPQPFVQSVSAGRPLLRRVTLTAFRRDFDFAADRSSNMRAALAFYERAIEFARPRGLRPLVAQCLAGMAEAWHVEGDVVTAADYKAQAQLVFDEPKVLSSRSL
jgi:hypothetical protein